jgi:AhpD family alkylhydroperoxidase
MSRLAMDKVNPGAYKAVYGMEAYARQHNDPVLFHLVKLRASMINGCAFCVDMHSREALADGEDSRRLFGLAAWHETPLYTEKERAALALTDSVTRLGQYGVPDDVWEAAAKEFSPEELGNLLMAIAVINVWNRFSIATQNQPPVSV